MNKEKYLEEIKKISKNIEPWKVMLNEYVRSSFVFGYYLSGEANEYIVYINDKNGKQSVKLTTENELKALETLLEIVNSL